MYCYFLIFIFFKNYHSGKALTPSLQILFSVPIFCYHQILQCYYLSFFFFFSVTYYLVFRSICVACVKRWTNTYLQEQNWTVICFHVFSASAEGYLITDIPWETQKCNMSEGEENYLDKFWSLSFSSLQLISFLIATNDPTPLILGLRNSTD